MRAQPDLCRPGDASDDPPPDGRGGCDGDTEEGEALTMATAAA